jgi:hypothetical protein
MIVGKGERGEKKWRKKEVKKHTKQIEKENRTKIQVSEKERQPNLFITCLDQITVCTTYIRASYTQLISRIAQFSFKQFNN